MVFLICALSVFAVLIALVNSFFKNSDRVSVVRADSVESNRTAFFQPITSDSIAHRSMCDDL